MEEKLDEKLSILRSDFYEKIDPVLKEVVARREERAIWSRKLIDHEQRIADLQSIHPNNDHPSSVN